MWQRCYPQGSSQSKTGDHVSVSCLHTATNLESSVPLTAILCELLNFYQLRRLQNAIELSTTFLYKLRIYMKDVQGENNNLPTLHICQTLQMESRP